MALSITLSSLALILTLLLVLLLVLGVPVAYAMMFSGGVGVLLLRGFGPGSSLLASSIHSQLATYTIITIPMFVLMAQYLKESGITEDIFLAVYRFISHIRGGLAMATAVANGLFAAMSGSSVAAAATMSTIAIPEMRKFGYQDRLSFGVVSAAGSFSTIIPPSITLIYYGILTETSIAALFMAGIVPGAITVCGYMVVIYLWTKINPEAAGTTDLPRFTWRERVENAEVVLPAALLVLLVLGGIYGGVFTPTEAGAIGALGAMVLGVVFGGLRTPGVYAASRETIKVTGFIVILFVGAVFYNLLLSLTGVTSAILSFIAALEVARWVIMFLFVLIYIALGTMMSALPIMVITLPITYPVAVQLGFEPVWFGIVIIKTIEVGLISPPFGLNVFVATSAMDEDPIVGFVGASRFIPVDLLVIVLLYLYPELALYIPETMI